MLRFYSAEEVTRTEDRHGSPDQPGDRRLGLWQSEREMATLNRMTGCRDQPPEPSRSAAETGAKMTMSNRKIAVAVAHRQRAWRAILAATALSAIILPGAADARVAGVYDGVWNVVFATTRGTCSSGYSVPFTVTGGRVSSAGGGRVRGSVSRAGSVAVSVQVGASRASGGGRLAGNYGGGYWSGIISGDRCSGTWRASR